MRIEEGPASAVTGVEPAPFFATLRPNGDRSVGVELGGGCDAATLDRVKAAMQGAVAARPTEVVVDLSDVSFVDSLTLGQLVAAAKKIRGYGGSFSVAGARAIEVRRSLELTGLETYFAPPGRT